MPDTAPPQLEAEITKTGHKAVPTNAEEANALLKAGRREMGGHLGQPVNLNIKGFKRYLSREFPGLTKSQRNYAISKYKTEAWSDYDEVVKYKMAEPTRPNRKKNDGKQGKQTADLPVAGE